MADRIVIKGAREHNLKNIDLEIPRDRLVVITGLSGSGKSSLAFDTIYAEGQRRYVESLSAYARQFLEQMEKPDVDSIDGLSPAISIEQKTTSRNPALDRRHHHRNLRLPAPALRPRRPRLLLQLRPRNHAAERPANRRSNHGMARRLAHSRARANRPRSQGRVSQGALRDEARRLRARQDRRQAPRTRRGAGPQQESAPHHRGDGRSARHPQGHREAPVGLARGRVQVRPGPAQGRAPGRAQERERDLFQPALRLRRLRNFVSGNRAADVLLQQPARRLHRVLGYRFDHVFRSRAGRAERGLEHRRWRDRAVGRR